MSRALAVRREAPGRFVDVDYRDLVGQPVPCVARLYEQLGRPLPAGVATSIAAWPVRHPQHEHGAHRYARDDFGLTAESMEHAFAPYLDQNPA